MWQAQNLYGVGDKYLRPVFVFKLGLVKRSRRRWPTWATYEEDKAFRKTKWNLKLRERGNDRYRMVFWDMTGIKTYKCGAADTQRATYSKYYASNCFKGGIFVQPCGFGGTWFLYAGRVSDTEYHEIAKYVEAQRKFQERDLVSVLIGNLIKLMIVVWTNVLDKGYCVTAKNRAEGKQRTLQPIFGKSGQKFKGEDTLFSGSVASLRSGNERYVLVSKRCGYIKEGFKVGMDPEVFDDVWLCWAFQANFMYDPVLYIACLFLLLPPR